MSWNVQHEYANGQRKHSYFLPHALSRLAHSPDSVDKTPTPLTQLATDHKQWLEDINEVLALCATYEGSLSITPLSTGLRFTQFFVSHIPKREDTVTFVATSWEEGLLCCFGNAIEHQAFDMSNFLECSPANQQLVLDALRHTLAPIPWARNCFPACWPRRWREWAPHHAGPKCNTGFLFHLFLDSA